MNEIAEHLLSIRRGNRRCREPAISSYCITMLHIDWRPTRAAFTYTQVRVSVYTRSSKHESACISTVAVHIDTSSVHSAGLRLWRPWCTQKNEAACPKFEIPSNRCSPWNSTTILYYKDRFWIYYIYIRNLKMCILISELSYFFYIFRMYKKYFCDILRPPRVQRPRFRWTTWTIVNPALSVCSVRVTCEFHSYEQFLCRSCFYPTRTKWTTQNLY